MAEMGGIANYGGSAAAMVDIVDEKTMKPNKTSLGGNKLVFVLCVCGDGDWRIASCQIYVVPPVKIKNCTRRIFYPFYGIAKMRCILRRI